MTPLEGLIRQEISTTGPMTVARYMELCLTHPEHGYYVTRDPLGAAGDFTTAPEVSQMFGEMIGVWAASVWDAMGRPDVKLVELGPGRGTLMADAMRVLRSAGASPEVWFVEISPTLQAAQARAVPGAQFAGGVMDVPDGPAIFIANEYFDALPVRQYLRAADGWRERLIGFDGERLIWGLGASETGTGQDGDWSEISTAMMRDAAILAKRLERHPGAALIVDYGYGVADRPFGPTLQAVRDHAYADPLETPGQADLTWLIDFNALEMVFQQTGAAAAITSQGAFLAEMGIGHRAQALADARPNQAEEIADALERLTGPDQMGSLFKVLGAVSPGLTLPPGFDALP